ncbi:MAG: phage tail tape measure protein [Candidatus Methylacidiphilales bacterium]
MADQKTNWILELTDKITAPLRAATASVDAMETAVKDVTRSVDAMDDHVVKSANNISENVNNATKSLSIMALQAGSEAMQNLGQPFLDGMEGTYAYDKSLRQLQSITGVTGEVITDIGERARKTATDFGGDAAEAVNSYTILLSKLTPEIAKNPQALDMMGRSVAMLAETMQGDMTGAVNSATSAVNQFGVDLTDPIAAAQEMERMLNIMVASAKVGSQDVPVLASALDEVGAMAKNARVGFDETNGALQVLGKFGKEGAEGGVALRNVFSILQKQEFLPKDVLMQLQAAGVNVDTLSNKNLTLADRLTELKKISGNDALLGGMFGQENSLAITALLGNIDLMRQYTKDIAADQTALGDSVKILATSYQEQKDKITSTLDDWKLSIYGATGAMLPFIDVGLSGILSIISIAPGIMATVQLFQALSSSQLIAAVATNVMAAAQWMLNIAMSANPIGLIVIGIAALISGIVLAYNYFDGFRALIDGLGETFKVVFESILNYFKLIMAPIRLVVGFLTNGTAGYNEAKAAIENDAVNLVANVKDVATGASFKKGYDNSLAANKTDEAAKENKGVDASVNKTKAQNPFNKNQEPAKPLTISGAAGSGSKSISMHIEIKNTFSNIASSLNVREVADQVAGVITDRIKDTLINAG